MILAAADPITAAEAAPTFASPEVLLTLLIVGGCSAILIFTRLAADAVLTAGLFALLVLGVVPAADGLAGFSNEALFTVAALYVVAEGVRQTGAMARLAGPLLGMPQSQQAAGVRLLLPAAAMSAFMNNTPVVAMLIPAVSDWAKRLGLSVSHLLLPLSYATILGGLCTVLGTSTTIAVNGVLDDPERVAAYGTRSLAFFEIAKVGLPVSLVGLVFLLVGTRRVLPDRKAVLDPSSQPREYAVEMQVQTSGAIDGRTIQQAGLRSLPGLFLAEVEREGNVLKAVSPTTPLAGGDRLVFVGAVSSVVDLKKIPGLQPATDQLGKLAAPRILRGLVEAVVSSRSPLVGQTIRQAGFRTRYNAVVIAVARNGERIPGKIGDIEVSPGDTLLLEAHPNFTAIHRDDRDFLLVSSIDDSAPVRHEKAWVALAVLGVMVAAAIGLDYLKARPSMPFPVPQAQSMFLASVVAAALMVLTRCIRLSEARESIDIPVLVTMASGIGLGHAMEHTHAAELVARGCISAATGSPIASLAVVAALTMVASNFITAKAAAFIALPIALETAVQTGSNPMAFAVAVMVAAACSFATPFGYQTNLMVYGPGGYKTSDFLRMGIPLSALVLATMTVAIAFGWPL